MESSSALVSRFFVGRSLDCEVLVSSPRVSTFHAEIRLDGPMGWVRDLGSRYGTTLNGRPVTDWAHFGAADRVVVGNSELSMDEAGGIEVRPAQFGATVCVAGLGVAVNRGRKVLLRNVSFVVYPGELVALMGLSGAGKSTLLKSLVGVIQPSWGNILINGVDLAKDPERARLAIGYVPQDDIVHSDLTVREALRHGAFMRLPLDTTADELEARTAVVMNDLDIGHAARTIIGGSAHSYESRLIRAMRPARLGDHRLHPRRPLLDPPVFGTLGLRRIERAELFTYSPMLGDHAVITRLAGVWPGY